MILHRLKQYIDYKGISISAFEKSIGMANASFRNSLKNNGTIGCDKLERILHKYPDLNIKWLFDGEGEMVEIENSLNNNSTDDVNIKHEYMEEPLSPYGSPITQATDPIVLLINQLSERDRLINDLHNEIRQLAEDNSRLKEKITGLIQDVQRVKNTDVVSDVNTGHSAAG